MENIVKEVDLMYIIVYNYFFGLTHIKCMSWPICPCIYPLVN